eukprot:GDKJ01013151.1.p1 GENE.GDKJ01013151.1~~GDKJ01013151.1.p1  ORF type:complete len:136 (-),score=23.93 GDKJ01013151.1:18-425(-)
MFKSSSTFLDDINIKPENSAQGKNASKVQLGEFSHLRETLQTLYTSFEDNEPVIPDELIRHYLKKVGCNAPDDNVIRVISMSVCNMLDKTMKRARVAERHDKDSREGLITSASLESSLPQNMKAGLVRPSMPQFH